MSARQRLLAELDQIPPNTLCARLTNFTVAEHVASTPTWSSGDSVTSSGPSCIAHSSASAHRGATKRACKPITEVQRCSFSVRDNSSDQKLRSQLVHTHGCNWEGSCGKFRAASPSCPARPHSLERWKGTLREGRAAAFQTHERSGTSHAPTCPHATTVVLRHNTTRSCTCLVCKQIDVPVRSRALATCLLPQAESARRSRRRSCIDVLVHPP
jgi:hypothetical protein